MSQPVQLTDVVPTVANLFDLDVEGSLFQGHDLSGWWSGEVPMPYDVIAEEEPFLRTLIRGSQKLIQRLDAEGQVEWQAVYEIDRDPGEQVDLSNNLAQPAFLGELERTFREYQERGLKLAEPTVREQLSPAELQALIELGYLEK